MVSLSNQKQNIHESDRLPYPAQIKKHHSATGRTCGWIFTSQPQVRPVAGPVADVRESKGFSCEIYPLYDSSAFISVVKYNQSLIK